MLTKNKGVISALLILFISIGCFAIVKLGSPSNNTSEKRHQTAEDRNSSRESLSSKNRTQISKRTKIGTKNKVREFRTISSKEALSEAITAIQEEHGLGVYGQELMTRLFSECDLDFETLFGFIDGIENSKTSDSALAGMLLRFPTIGDGELAHQFDLTKILKTKSGCKTLEKGFGFFVGAVKPEQQEQRMREVLVLLGGHYADRLSNDRLGAVIAASVAQPGLSVDLLKIVQFQTPELFLNEKFTSELVEIWGKDDLLAAFSHASTLGILDPTSFFTIARKAFEYDSVSTEALHTLLPQESIEAFAAARMRWEIDQGQFKNAQQTIDSTTDKVLKKRLEGAFWRVENKAVSQAANKDAKRLVMEFASGASEFGSYQMPTALKAWIKEDHQAAAEWATSEGRELPPETRQWVAMTYAREAANQGDTQLALEWADLILDETRKARVMQHINWKR